MLSLLVAAMLAGTAASDFFQTSVFHSSGIDVGAPLFISTNSTWQFKVTVTVQEGSIVIPLFRDILKTDPFGTHDCTGFVSLCCLYVMNVQYMNDELDAYLNFLGACTLHTNEATKDVLVDAPPTDSLILNTFPRGEVIQTANGIEPRYPRAWCLSAYQCVYEVASSVLRGDWFSEVIPSEIPNEVTVDRKTVLTIAYISPTLTHNVQIVLTTIDILFHDSGPNSDLPSNFRHHAFHHFCADELKPQHAMWRVDVIDSNLFCTWFCEPGYVLYPTAIDWHFMTTTTYSLNPNITGQHRCLKQPTHSLVLLYNIVLHLSGYRPHLASDLYVDTMMSLQQTMARLTDTAPQHSTYYLQSRYLNYVFSGSTITRVYDMSISFALFVPDCSLNMSIVLDNITDILQNKMPDALQEDMYNVYGRWIPGVNVELLLNEATSTCPPPPQFPHFVWYILAGTWGALVLLCLLFGCAAALSAARRRRKNLHDKLAPLMKKGFEFRNTGFEAYGADTIAV